MASRILVALASLVIMIGICSSVEAAQLGAGLHYLRTMDDLDGEISQDDFSIFGTVTIPVAMLRIEGNVEWVPDYLGSDEHLIQPAAYGLLPLGMLYGGVGIGIGYLTGDLAGWATNPFYALRAGVDLELGGLALDAFASYRFQNASFLDGASHVDLDALTLAAQIKFGG